MTQEVFGLRYEFVYRHGHHMELYKEGGLAASELSTLQVRMLEANQVPRLLLFDIHEVDARLRLQYKLSSKRMLSHVLKVETLSIHQLAKLVYAIVCTLDESKNYMLYEMNFVLKDNFIFVGQEWSDVYLTYVPLNTQHDGDDICPAIDALLGRLILHIEEEERNQLHAWISTHLVTKSLLGYKEALLKLMDVPILVQKSVTAAQSEPDANVLPERVPEPELGPGLRAGAGLPKAHWKREDDKQTQSNIPHMAQPAQKQTNGQAQQKTINNNVSQFPLSFIPLNQRERWITIALILIVAAFLWQIYLTYPSTSMLQIIAGSSLLLGDAGFVLLCIGRPDFSSARNTKQIAAPLDFTTSNNNHAISSASSSIAVPLDIQDYYHNLPQHTTLLTPSKPNATVFLGGKSSNPQPLGPRLEFQIEGISQTVPINSDVFTIGRGDSSSKVDYVMEVAGVSRIHAEIVQTSEGFQLRDAGSTNGTYLNDQPMVTYQAYSLKDGDIVRIIRQEMTFRR